MTKQIKCGNNIGVIFIGQSRELRVKCLRMGVVSERSTAMTVRDAFPASAATNKGLILLLSWQLSRKEFLL